ncbi:hypothetical protein JXQ70_03705 [bacterium]|nr:hypothetical protein [bacterium]
MKIIRYYRALWNSMIGLILLLIAGFLVIVLAEFGIISERETSYAGLPDYDYVADIRSLKAEGKLSEALEMARYVVRQGDMPGHEQAQLLALELESELSSLWGRAWRVANGFIKGSGNSIEELSGGIASDLIVWGDIRDLFKQGYYRITGQETDPLIVVLAGVGLLTEVVDAADWAPAVLKAFRKTGALSRQLADYIINAGKQSVKVGKLDGALKTVFTNLRGVIDHVGLARTAAILKHVDTPADLGALTKVARKNADAAYFTVKNGGREGLDIIKGLGDSEAGIEAMAKAARKGPAGIQWLKRSGSGHKYVLLTRVGARIFKNIRLDRPQQILIELAKKYKYFQTLLWIVTITCLAGAFLAFIRSGWIVFHK